MLHSNKAIMTKLIADIINNSYVLSKFSPSILCYSSVAQKSLHVSWKDA
jgi:hypothetical protein